MLNTSEATRQAHRLRLSGAMTREQWTMRLRLAIAVMLVLAQLTSSHLTVPAADAAATATGSRTYYVDCASRVKGTGARAKPWNTLKAVNGHGQFLPGERILLRRGSSCKGSLHPTGSGSRKKPIIIGAYGTGPLPRVDGGGTAEHTGAVMLVDASNWTIQDLRVTNKAPKSTMRYRAGVLLKNTAARRSSGITVRRLVITDVRSNPTYDEVTHPWAAGGEARLWGGITVWTTRGAPGGGFDSLRIFDNRLKQIGRSGIAVFNFQWPTSSDRDVRISGNRIERARGDGLVLYGSKHARIDHNVSAYAANFWPCPQCRVLDNPQWANAAIWATRVDGVRIDHNEAYGTFAKGGDGEGFDIDIDSRRVVFEYNYSHDNRAGGLLLCGSIGAIVRFNIFQNDRRSALVFIGNRPAVGTRIYNNTIYSSQRSKAAVVRYFNGAHGTDSRFYNNLVYAYGSGAFNWPAPTWTSANTVIGIAGPGHPEDPLTSWRDPGLRNPGSGGLGLSTLTGYRPSKSTSPLRGIAIPRKITRDFFGKRIDPSSPPRGAAG